MSSTRCAAPHGSPPAKTRVRLRVTVRGAVQGVGFRPFVYRNANDLALDGWVINSPQGVCVEVEGFKSVLDKFLQRLQTNVPPCASIQSLEHAYFDAVGFDGFEIRESAGEGPKTTLVLPDIATCPGCLRDISNPNNRRYRYPFTNCTNCGPRFSIVNAIPYDRANTSMSAFEMCPECSAEYDDPLDRRFHAQPNACPACGPHVEFWDRSGETIASRDAAVREAAGMIRAGKILALKGLGGFQLIVDAQNDAAVRRLRERKHRDQKPLAVMMPSLDSAHEHCRVSAEEQRLLQSPESPIVLLPRRESSSIAAAVAPGNPHLGVMRPYTPLHHILMTDLGYPVVATSGNLAEDPICTGENEALDRLGSIADGFLVHNRPIVRHVDDSVVRVIAGRPLVLRRARGYAPLPIALGSAHRATASDSKCADKTAVLAVGAHLKNTVALAVNGLVFLSQHNGDLSTRSASAAFEKSISDLTTLYGCEPGIIACDLHPDYRSTSHGISLDQNPEKIQHHAAHVFACMAENELAPPVSGVSWDGTGFGTDGTIWGGEFLGIRQSSCARAGHLRTFRLPGGDAAAREPRRAALGLLYETFGNTVFEMDHLAPVRSFSKEDRRVLRAQLQKGLNAPATSSAGRLFDAVASIIDVRQINGYEGQAAMELEFAAAKVDTGECYSFDVVATDGKFVVNWESMIRSIITETAGSTDIKIIAAKFHNTLAEIVKDAAGRMNEERVVLTGGCFQNQYLSERSIVRLENGDFRPYWHQRVPPNDGGIALGQVAATAYLNNGEAR